MVAGSSIAPRTVPHRRPFRRGLAFLRFLRRIRTFKSISHPNYFLIIEGLARGGLPFILITGNRKFTWAYTPLKRV